MKLIAGLGNPGKAYLGSRHNIGFDAIEALARKQGVVLKKGIFSKTAFCRMHYKGKEFILARPLTFMNLSGASIKYLAGKFKVASGDILIICDDLDLQLGRMKIKQGGSSAGHHGLESIASSLKDKDFCRLRLGIGRPKDKDFVSEYVLSRFTQSENGEKEQILRKAVQCCYIWAEFGINKAMEIFNKKVNKEQCNE
ncbi:MAG: aminoacyl-tRNA hydrolase [Candidatus Omnitrophica bacterium]|jgi:PTH1 family peptidyl-tRNA hydrolase|nr:aminoacyl-tRNA hydrolase [Candidatus Omnitrophota bacterium]